MLIPRLQFQAYTVSCVHICISCNHGYQAPGSWPVFSKWWWWTVPYSVWQLLSGVPGRWRSCWRTNLFRQLSRHRSVKKGGNTLLLTTSVTFLTTVIRLVTGRLNPFAHEVLYDPHSAHEMMGPVKRAETQNSEWLLNTDSHREIVRLPHLGWSSWVA